MRCTDDNTAGYQNFSDFVGQKGVAMFNDGQYRVKPDSLGTAMYPNTPAMVPRSIVHPSQIGTPYELNKFPRNRFVATFVGSPRMNLLATSGGGTADFGKLDMPAGMSRVGIRPEYLVPGDDGTERQGHAGRVSGQRSVCPSRPARWSGIARAGGRQVADKMGDTAKVSFDAKDAHYFDESGSRVALDDAVPA